MRGLPVPPILAISDLSQARLPLPELAGRLLDAGCRWFSLREKHLPQAEQAALIELLAPRFRAAGAVLSLHAGDASLAGECGLKAVHLSRGGDVIAARRHLGPDSLIGISCHDAGELARAAEGEADYATLSPVFESRSKAGYTPLEPAGRAALLAAARLPVVALGGIEGPEEVEACRRMGAAGLAVMGPLMRAQHPGELFRTLERGWEGAGA